MKRLGDVLPWVRDTVLRLLPHATRPGLFPVGTPGRHSPVLCTGNFTLTVRRMKEALAQHDAWLLVTNTHGINVWCAAGGGHLTHHTVIAALRSFEVDRHLDHRTLVLPQLAATGVERERIARATGWKSVWGPARLEDLPGFLERGLKVRKSERTMRFPLWERLEMALTWLVPMVAVAWLALWAASTLTVALAGAVAIAGSVLGTFAALPWVSVGGRARYATHGAFALGGWGLGLIVLGLGGQTGGGALGALAVTCAASAALLSVDLAGTTPWYPGTINSVGNHFELELVDEKCTGAAQCVLVCPREVLQMDGARRKVKVALPEQCILCGACIVQCPDDALRFRFTDGRVVEPATVRSTRLNLLGRRAVQLPVEVRRDADGTS